MLQIETDACHMMGTGDVVEIWVDREKNVSYIG
jgi:hypothetical protein